MKSLRRCMLQVGLCTLFIQSFLSQEPSPAFVEGVVVKFAGTELLSRASVELRGPGVNLATTTDNEGRFFFPKVPPGQYRLRASRAGYIDAEYGQRPLVEVLRSPMVSMPPSLSLASGQRLSGIRVELTPGSVISGRVTVSGKPLGNVDVKAMVASYELGQRVMTAVLSTRTNDLGEYRIFWLPPGKYYVAAEVLELAAAASSQTITTGLDVSYNPLTLNSMPMRFVISRAIGAGTSETTTFAISYPPGTPDWRTAIPVELDAGSEARGVDIQVNPINALHVRGRITGIPLSAGGQPVRPALSLSPLNGASTSTPPLVQVQSDGSFDISRVSPGSHVLSAAAGNVSGRIAVDVFDRDVNAISLALAPGLTVSGRVLIDGPSARTVDPRFTELRISLLDELIPAGFRQNNRSAALPLVTPRADGSFTIPASSGGAVPAGRYRVLVGPILTAAAGWASPPAALPASVMPTAVIPSALEGAYVKSVRMGDINVLDDGLRLNTQPSDLLLIVLGTNPGSLEGRVRNQQQRAVAGATVVLIPESGLQFKVNHKFTSTDVSGGFRITAIPPGNYSLYAWENVEAGAWQDPDFVGSHRGRGTPIQVREGQKLSLTDIVSIPARP